MKNDQVTFLYDNLAMEGMDWRREGLKSERQLGKILKSSKDIESFRLRLKK